MNHIITQMEKY